MQTVKEVASAIQASAECSSALGQALITMAQGLAPPFVVADLEEALTRAESTAARIRKALLSASQGK